MATTSIWAVKGWLGKVVLYICYHILALTSIPTIDIEPHKFKGARSWLTVLL